MTHIDRDDLALIAMAEQGLSEPERLHLSECPECSLELISLQHAAAVGRSARAVELVEPGDRVWSRIHSALGLSDAVAATPRRSDYEGTGVPAPQPTSGNDLISGNEPTFGNAGPRPVRPLAGRARRRRARFWLPVTVAAGIVGLVGGVGGGIWWESLRQSVTPPGVVEQKIAEARLDPYPGWNAGGTAYVEKTADGHREVVVDLTGVTNSAPLREVWLIKADASGLVSIGLLNGNTGRFSIPDGLDLARYPLVDVSAEPDNGNPAHSGDSIVRGLLHSI